MDETPPQPTPEHPDEHIFTPEGTPLGEPPKRRWWRPVLVAVGVVLGLVVLFEGVVAARRHYSQHNNTANPVTGAHTAGTNTNATPIPTPASATDNASLQQDLQSASSSLNGSTSSQNDVNSGLNDSANKVDVPTN
ncbi:MAG TPA: hypothetical protein VLF71_00425 [Candidatus Saccharimonadales bacterium]|nr:hypothetical protein [Candidatus Saccharimonadales bacterium]